MTQRAEIVKKFIESYEPDTFVKNQHGVMIYTAGPSSLNLESFFEDLVDFVIEEIENKKQ